MMATPRSIRAGLAAFLLVLGMMPSPGIQAQTTLPESFSVTYVLTKGPLSLAEMTRKLYKNDAGHYVYESFSKPIGYARWFTDSTLLEKSEWIYHEQHLRPLEYSYDRQSSKKERHVKLTFDWDKMRVTNNINNDPWSMAIPAGTLDKLLYHLAVMYDLGRGDQSLTYQVADGGTLKTYQFHKLGEETIETPLGRFETVKLARPGSRDTILWCAKALNYLPVRIMQEEDGSKLTLKLKSFSGLRRDTAQAAASSTP